MPHVKLQSEILGTQKERLITPKQFQEKYAMSRSQAYKILAMPEFEEVKFKTGTRGFKVKEQRAHQIMCQVFN